MKKVCENQRKRPQIGRSKEALKDREEFLETHQVRAVMVYLLMENADRGLHRDLALSLRCLARFFWHYPIDSCP